MRCKKIQVGEWIKGTGINIGGLRGPRNYKKVPCSGCNKHLKRLIKLTVKIDEGSIFAWNLWTSLTERQCVCSVFQGERTIATDKRLVYN